MNLYGGVYDRRRNHHAEKEKGKMLSKALRLCRNYCELDDERLVAALKQGINMLPPTTSRMRKDHKAVKEGQEQKGSFSCNC